MYKGGVTNYGRHLLLFYGLFLLLTILGGGFWAIVEFVWIVIKVLFWPLAIILAVLAVGDAVRRK
jgi:hypothetical protein